MRPLIIILVLAVGVIGATLELKRSVRSGRIPGGNDVDISEYPYQLSLQSGGGHICGASIISANWAVTAAHCVYGMSASRISLRAGTSERGSGGSVHQASSINVHSNFDYNTIDYDVAVIEVDPPFEFGNNSQPIVLEDSAVTEGTRAILTGWGKPSEEGNHLRAATLPVVSSAKCNESYGGLITDRMLCAEFDISGSVYCQGNSGGPLAAGGRLIAIVSWAYGCGLPKYPDVYTNVSSVRSWIASSSGV